MSQINDIRDLSQKGYLHFKKFHLSTGLIAKQFRNTSIKTTSHQPPVAKRRTSIVTPP